MRNLWIIFATLVASTICCAEPAMLISEAEFAERLAELKKSQPGLSVVVRPHKELPVQNFVRIMDLLHKAGITKVGVMTRPEDQGGASAQ